MNCKLMQIEATKFLDLSLFSLKLYYFRWSYVMFFSPFLLTQPFRGSVCVAHILRLRKHASRSLRATWIRGSGLRRALWPGWNLPECICDHGASTSQQRLVKEMQQVSASLEGFRVNPQNLCLFSFEIWLPKVKKQAPSFLLLLPD